MTTKLLIFYILIRNIQWTFFFLQQQ